MMTQFERDRYNREHSGYSKYYVKGYEWRRLCARVAARVHGYFGEITACVSFIGLLLVLSVFASLF